MSSPAKVIRAYLVANGLGVLPAAAGSPDWKVFVGKEPQDPDNIITVYNPAGLIELKNMRDGEQFVHHGVQFRFRNLDYELGWAKGIAVKDLMTKGTKMSPVAVPGDSTDWIIQSFNLTMDLAFLLEEEKKNRQVFTMTGRITLLTGA